MRRFLFLGVLMVFIAAINAEATPMWDVVTGSDVTTSDYGLIINPGGNVQSQGLHGAGFMSDGPTVSFSVDLWTNDAYSSASRQGWYDVFFVNINQIGYVFDSAWSDPVTDPNYRGGKVTDQSSLAGSTLAWGGTSWWDCTRETFAGDLTLSLDNFNPDADVFVSVGWKTTQDDFFTSGGTVDVMSTPAAPVPEPATMMLFGAGLAGLVGVNRGKRKKS